MCRYPKPRNCLTVVNATSIHYCPCQLILSICLKFRANLVMEQAIGLYDFKAAEENELSTYKNEILEVVNKDQEWWTVKNKYGQTGLVPVSYVAAPVDGSDTQIISRGKTTKSHKAKTENELSMEKGKQIAILDNSDTYWWFVGYSGQTGYLPKNIIQEFKVT